ncbi:MAG: DUF393 domain-containing protein [Pseudomonadota bacterium]
MPEPAPHPGKTATPAGEPTPAQVYFDGACALCSLEIRHYAARADREHLCFVDVSDPSVSLGADLDRTAAMGRFHLRQPDGTLVSGARAFVALWETLPGWRWLARVVRLPGVIHLAELAYRMFLPIRPVLSRQARRFSASPVRPGPK